MPALKNIRQERFCQLVSQGIPPFRFRWPAIGLTTTRHTSSGKIRE
jgi:hypothetical protein